MIVIESKDFYFIAKYIVPYVPFYMISILLLAGIEMYFASVKWEKRPYRQHVFMRDAP